MVYTLSKGLGISPIEAYNLPCDLFMDMLIIHGQIETLKSDEIEKSMNKAGV